MKAGAACALVQETLPRRQIMCVELQRDGERTVFVCKRCGTRCYSDGALLHHLQGNVHTRLSAALNTIENNFGNQNTDDEHAIVARRFEERPRNEGATYLDCLGGVPAKIVLVDLPSFAGSSKTSLEWIGSDELFFGVRSSVATPVVDSAWFNWKGKGLASSCQVGFGGGFAYAVVKFPYSDMIGRAGDWKPWSADSNQTRSDDGIQAEERLLASLSSTSTPETSLLRTTNSCRALVVPNRNSPPCVDSVIDNSNVSQFELEKHREKQKHGVGSSKLLQPIRERKKTKAKAVERLCFICHQRMSSGNDVASLLNLRTKQMVCCSRNKQGAFHVYHPTCLIDWISLCELKTFTGQVAHEGAIFCPECQGTGLNLLGAQLERPRYSLSEVFDRILELVQARKAWSDNLADNLQQNSSRSGLFFNDQLQGTVQSRGLVHYYSGCVDLLTGSD